MASKFIEMTMDEWEATYRPIPNHIDENASFQNDEGVGIMFETYGDEVAFVKSQDPAKIWTYGDGDDGESHIWNGWHFINRIGYFITEVPCPPDTEIQINLNDYYYFCEGCHEEWEGDVGHLINDTLGEIEKCPACATMEELKEYEYEGTL